MPNRIETYPLIERLQNDTEIFAAGIIVCVINLNLLPQGVIDYLQSPDRPSFDTDALNNSLDQIKIWIINEKTEKPSEHGSFSKNLRTPPQETRKSNEYLIATLTATLIEECLPLDQLNATYNHATFSYIPRSSYLGHVHLEYPSTSTRMMNKHRADHFMVGYSGESHTFQVPDEEIEPVGWIAIGEYLQNTYPARRLGGKTVVEKSRKHLLHFLETYWQNPTAYQQPICEAIDRIGARKLQPDFNKRKSALIVVEATEFFPAS